MDLSPKSSALVKYPLSDSICRSWESALTDVIGVLKIQYRSDNAIKSFLDNFDKVKQLQFSTAARMEWNKRVAKDEMESGIHSPPRARRIAKEVAIDYIRRCLDVEDEKLLMCCRFEDIQREKYESLETMFEYERELKRSRDEDSRLALSDPISRSWESALTHAIGVLKIQYRSDDAVKSFLDNFDKVKQLQFSATAKMEWDKRVAKDEMESGIHSPPRARRIAKEVAVDYIRKCLDVEDEKLLMCWRLEDIQREKYESLETLFEYERESWRSRDENSKLALPDSISRSWENALTDVIGVLKTQYRSDEAVKSFLDNFDKVRQLQFSTTAKMEWNRRVANDEIDSGIHSPPRARRIAKEVAIDYIRRCLDVEDEKLLMCCRLEDIQREKYESLETMFEYERESKRSRDENSKLALSNQELREENKILGSDIESIKLDSLKIKKENAQVMIENDTLNLENGKLEEENKMVSQENHELKNENGSLTSENQKVMSENQNQREEREDVRAQNVKIRGENESLRGENQEVTGENLKLRRNNTTFCEDNERLRRENATLTSENKKLIQDNLRLNAHEDEMRMIVNIEQSLLAGETETTKRAVQLQTASFQDTE